MDSIHMGSSWYWVRALMERMAEAEMFPEPVSEWVPPDTFALFIAIAREWPDSEEDFPRGKWASIQHLESLLSEAIKQTLPRESSSA